MQKNNLHLTTMFLNVFCALGGLSLINSAAWAHPDQSHTYRLHEKSGKQVIKTSKTGAAIHFSHQFNGPLIRGQVNESTLTLDHNYRFGTLNLTMNAPPEIRLNRTEFQQDLNTPGRIDIPLEITAFSQGVHIVNILASWDNGQGLIERRAYTIPVQFGADQITRKASLRGGYVMLPVEETTN